MVENNKEYGTKTTINRMNIVIAGFGLYLAITGVYLFLVR